MSKSLKIIDSHVHLYDYKANQHTFLEAFDPNYAAFVGDYSTMPRQYLVENYLKDSVGFQVDGVIWHEFLSTDPIKEAKWAQDLAKQSGLCQSMVVLVDFLDPDLEEKLEIYSTLPNVTAVREHMVWDNENPRKRFAKRPDLLRVFLMLKKKIYFIVLRLIGLKFFNKPLRESAKPSVKP